MRSCTAAFALVLIAFAATPVRAEVHVGINIGVPAWTYVEPPHVVVVPGIPTVHYAPDVAVNFFTYGGRYYTYDEGHWFVAYDDHGPWSYVERSYVPAPVLRVPTRYYRVPPRLVGGGHWHQTGYHDSNRTYWSGGRANGGHGNHAKGGHGHGGNGHKHGHH
jgi:hypothetical protein